MSTHKPQLSVFYIPIDRIDPNPFQPRAVFEDGKLNNLAQSIRRYGVLQPLVVTKKEMLGEQDTLQARYELIAGERRLRASKIAGLREVPVVIRSDIKDDTERLELAIIENLQREDLNPVDRARAFKKLVEDFKMTQTEVGEKMGMSREYISNSLRLLTLPNDMVQAVSDGKISEGHTRPLLMLTDRPQEQRALFDEIQNRRITVRESELIARRCATERARTRSTNHEMEELESEISARLNTRVHIRSNGKEGGKIVIDYFSPTELQDIIAKLQQEQKGTEELVNEEKQHISNSDEDDMYTFKNFSL